MKNVPFFDLESRALLRQRLDDSRNRPALWKETKSKNIWNPFCHEHEKIFMGFDHYYQRPAWRKVRTFIPLRSVSQIPVIVVPPTGGFGPLDQFFATRLALKGYPTYVLSSFEGWDDYSSNISRHDRQSVQSISALKELQHWLDRPTYFIGASLGAMYGLQAFGSDPAVKKIVLVVGGEDFAGIITDSELPIATRNKEERKKQFNLKSDYDYRIFMKGQFCSDPSLFVRKETESQKYLIFISENDKIVPTAYQEALVRRLPHAHVIHLRTGHMMSVVRTYLFFQKEILRFLNSEPKKSETKH